MLEILKALLLGLVQGITEWLPVSSTGHMILLDEFIKLNFSPQFVSTFLVVVQLGSIMAVVVLFWRKLNPFSPALPAEKRREIYVLWGKVLVASLPAAVIGLLFDDAIDALFYNPLTVAITLVVYGILFILLERRPRKPSITGTAGLTYTTALLIGAFQVLALIPGTSRSGATILGAMLLGASRIAASEFSFYMAIPVMLGASGLKLLKAGFAFAPLEWAVLLVGSLVAFVVSVWAIRFLLGYIRRNNFKPFGYYRIALGLLVLLYFYVVR